KNLFFKTFILLTIIFYAGYCKAEEKNSIPYDADLFKKDTTVTFLDLEFLYWTANAGNLEYSFKYDKNISDVDTIYGVGKFKFADYDYNPGFRIALGWFNAPKYWQIYSQFTWVKIKGKNSSTEDISNILVATFPQAAILDDRLSKAKSSLKLNNEIGDILISRVFIPNPHLRLRLLGGLTGGRIKQRWKIDYIDVELQKEKVLNQFKFLGIGFRAGLDFDWFWGRNFYLTGKTSLASLAGKYKNTGKIFDYTNDLCYNNHRYNQFRGAYNLQFLMGPSYQKAFEKTRIEFLLAYELNSWFNILEVVRTSGKSIFSYPFTEELANINNGALLLHGLTVKLNIDF
ncbi:MAG: hypothetical protein AMS24_04760, partial [Chlamydiae bacterium SM23_39]